MPKFVYTGRATIGAVSGELDGADASAVAALLMSRGVTPLQINAASVASAKAGGAKPGDLALPKVFQPQVLPADLMLFSRQLHTLLRAGVPILRALAGLQESAVNPKMKSTLASVRQSLESGIELSVCFAQQGGVFDHFYVSMVRVGEMTGRLDEVFLRLFKHIEFESFMHQQVKSAIRYPSFVVGAMVIAVGVINTLVVPAFANVFKSFHAELPLATRLLVGSSEFTLRYGWALGLAAAAGFFALRRWKSQPAGRRTWDRWLLKAPLAGRIVQMATLSRFARSFAIALKSGVPIEQALTVVAQTVGNAHISRKVEAMRETVERGDTILRAAIAAGIFTPVVLQMIAVGEETGAIDELMEEIADLYSNEVQYELKALSQQIEPILIVFLGALVLLLALGVFLPLWDLGRVSLQK
jgi:MSHA biogenesis protein MshG